MSSDLNQNINTRKYIRTKVTKYYNKVESSLNEFSKIQKDQYINELKEISIKLEELNLKIQTLNWDESKTDNEENHFKDLETCEVYNERIAETLSVLNNSLIEFNTSSLPNQNLTFQPQMKLKPPKAPLPKFDGSEDESLEKFFYNFEAIIDQFGYSSYEKFTLLKEQLSGRALILIESLEISKQSYKEAKDLLILALASPLNQKYSAIQKLLDLKLNYSKDPYTFVAEMRMISESFKVLEIDIDIMLQFFFWRSMNDTLQNQFIQITNSNKPSLKEINDHIFPAIERYLSVTKKFNEKKQIRTSKAPTSTFGKSTNNFASNVNYSTLNKSSGFKPCVLCSKDQDADHPIYRCQSFVTIEDKIKKLRSLQGCERCANLNHVMSDCRYKFNAKCRNCNEWHFSFLCQNMNKQKPKIDKDQKPKNKALKNETNNGTVWVEQALPSYVSGDIILPTFTCSLKNEALIRCMKDSGCQANFIAQHIVEKYKFEVVKSNVSLTVNGFNNSKDYTANIVKVGLTFGNKLQNIEAIVVPNISIKLKLPKLGHIVSEFNAKGYSLADKNLTPETKEINEIDLILGIKSIHCIPENTVLFGSNTDPSAYINTHLGVILAGETDEMLRNLKALPNLISCMTDAPDTPLKLKTK